MSWYETVVNTVNTVSKHINTALGFIINPTSAANPFRDKIQGKPNKSTSCESDENENEYGNEEYESGGEGSSQSPADVSRNRIASRARYSYQLDRFKKNAMLLFMQIVSEPQNGCRDRIKTYYEAKKMENTFNDFRFEVDIHEDLTCAEIDSKCQEFFQRDFRQYGAVIVVVMSFDGTNGQIAAFDGLFSESVILRHLTDDLNPSLLNKPKVYITETNRSGAIFFMGQRLQYSVPIQEHHHDVLMLHIPVLDYGSVRRGPLSFICENINKLAGTKDFVTIIEKSIEDASRQNSMFDADFLPISFSHTFSKEMMLYGQVPQ